MRTKRFLSVALLSVFMCLCFLFTGCSSTPSGVYMVKKVQIQDDGNSITLNVGDIYDDMEVTEDMLSLKIMKDGTVVLRVREYYEDDGKTESYDRFAVGMLYEGIEKDYYVIKVAIDDYEEECFVLKKEGKNLVLDVGDGVIFTLHQRN